MSIAEKLKIVAENQQKVYDAGFTAGQATGGDTDAAYQAGFDAGKQAEYDAFWDVFQNNGNPTNYYYKFSYDAWTDDNFNPKYPVVCANATTPGMALFYANPKITDTKVPITILGSSAQAIFLNATSLPTIRKLTLNEKANLSNAFNDCRALTNLTIDGVIGNFIDLQWSPLTKPSIESVVNALSSKSTGQTATFKKTAVNAAFTTDEWNALVATKPNWTITLA